MEHYLLRNQLFIKTRNGVYIEFRNILFATCSFVVDFFMSSIMPTICFEFCTSLFASFAWFFQFSIARSERMWSTDPLFPLDASLFRLDSSLLNPTPLLLDPKPPPTGRTQCLSLVESRFQKRLKFPSRAPKRRQSIPSHKIFVLCRLFCMRVPFSCRRQSNRIQVTKAMPAYTPYMQFKSKQNAEIDMFRATNFLCKHISKLDAVQLNAMCWGFSSDSSHQHEAKIKTRFHWCDKHMRWFDDDMKGRKIDTKAKNTENTQFLCAINRKRWRALQHNKWRWLSCAHIWPFTATEIGCLIYDGRWYAVDRM